MGALCNILDYFFYGHVIDMLHFVFWGYDYPVFNVADSFICIGVFWLFFASLKEFMNLRKSTLQAEGQYQASKWISLQALLEVDEMAQLLTDLGEYYMAMVGQVCGISEGILSKEEFVAIYSTYIDQLKHGHLPDETVFRPAFSSVLTRDLDSLYAIELNESQHLIRVSRPCVQMQFHRMHYSEQDGKFRPMIFGTDSIIWGIQFSYPQIFQDNQTKEVFQGLERFPNTGLFRSLQRWLRQHTIPTPFLADGKEVNIPIRIGRGCLPWINQHPQLVQKGLQVRV